MEDPQVPKPEQYFLHIEREDRVRTGNRRRNKCVGDEDSAEQHVRQFEPTLDDQLSLNFIVSIYLKLMISTLDLMTAVG